MRGIQVHRQKNRPGAHPRFTTTVPLYLCDLVVRSPGSAHRPHTRMGIQRARSRNLMGWYRNTYFPISVADSLLRSEATWGTIRIYAAHSESEVAPGPRGLEPRGHGGAARLRLQNGYCERLDGEVADARAALRARPRRAWHSGSSSLLCSLHAAVPFTATRHRGATGVTRQPSTVGQLEKLLRKVLRKIRHTLGTP